MSVDYTNFLDRKTFRDIESGFEISEIDLPAALFPFQRALVQWALRRGRAALFCDTGLGKSFMQVAWADQIAQRVGPVLIVAPLCVSQQTVEEAAKLGIDVRYVRSQSEIQEYFDAGCAQVNARRIWITNYEMLEHFDLSAFSGVVLDESSIIKHRDSKTRNRVIAAARSVPYKLSCTATPSPNDYMELGNQAEFLGVMNMNEMLAMFFTHDSGETSKWRLKGHGRVRFWEWLSTWAVVVKKPSDLGFDDAGYILPGLEIIEHMVPTDKMLTGHKIQTPASTLSERLEARRLTIDERVAKCAELVNGDEDEWIIWCNLNEESSKLAAAIPGAVEVFGSLKLAEKERRIEAFTSGSKGRIVTKPSITGFGLNWQHCRKMAFVGLNDSYEDLYQAIRRCYRFGQDREVIVHLISSVLEGATLENIKRKEAQAEEMSRQMVEHMRDFMSRRVRGLRAEKSPYDPRVPIAFPAWLSSISV
jgi:hypothetical protein